MPVGTVDTHLAVAQLIFRQADRYFTLFTLQATVQDKGLLFVTNHAANLQTTKRPTMAERIDSFKYAGFAAAVGANQEIKAGREGEIRIFNIAEVFD